MLSSDEWVALQIANIMEAVNRRDMDTAYTISLIDNKAVFKGVVNLLAAENYNLKKRVNELLLENLILKEA